MSKSLGNFFTIREIMETYPAEVVRYFLVSSHYRSQVDYSEDNLIESGRSLTKLYNALRGVTPLASDAVEQTAHDTQFAERMDDDFNCAGAMAILHAIAGEINQQRRDGDEQAAAASATVLVRLGSVLGLLQQDPELFFQGSSGSGQGGELNAEQIETMIQARADARKARDFAGADRIRDELLEQGVILDDSREGTSWRRG
jgi:cysteinyl-tRNA synthetase